MNHRKWVHNFFFYALVSTGVALLAVMAVSDARATGGGDNDDNGTPPVEVDQDQNQGQHQAQGQGQAQGQAQGQTASGTGTASANVSGSATGSASNDGNTLDAGDNTTNNRSNFFSFNSSLPNAGECFGAAQGGGGDGGGGGFFGIRMLNNDCWFSALAEAEENVQVRARLKCASKMFRNAIAYEQPRNKRQQRCIGFMVSTYVEQIEHERAQVQAMLDSQTLLIQDHVSKETNRTTDTLTRVVETCADCYGEKSK